MKTKDEKLRPSDLLRVGENETLKTKKPVGDEGENIEGLIKNILIALRNNGNLFIPFTWEDYVAFCDHIPEASKKDISEEATEEDYFDLLVANGILEEKIEIVPTYRCDLDFFSNHFEHNPGRKDNKENKKRNSALERFQPSFFEFLGDETLPAFGEKQNLLRNIVIISVKKSHEEWKGFSWREYSEMSTHDPHYSEKTLLDQFVAEGILKKIYSENRPGKYIQTENLLEELFRMIES